MRHADILRLHYEYAFARRNPGKPIVLPPNGFGARALPAPAAAPMPETASDTRLTTSERAATYDSTRPVLDALRVERETTSRFAAPLIVEMPTPLRPSPTMHAQHVVETNEAERVELGTPPRDTYQRAFTRADLDAAAPVQNAFKLEAHEDEISRTAATSKHPAAGTDASQGAVRPRRWRPGRRSVLAVGALVIGIGGIAHLDPHAIRMAWSTYRAEAHPIHAQNAGRAAQPAAASPTVQASAVVANATGSRAGITIPMAPAEPSRALTSQDLMQDGQKAAPLSNVSPESLRADQVDPTAQRVAEVVVPASHVDVYAAPIRKVLDVIHHPPQPVPAKPVNENYPSQPAPAKPVNETTPAKARPERSSEDVARSRNPHSTAADVATPAANNVPARAAQQAKSQDANGDQTLF
jgi:hypothetical protein